MSRKGNKAKHLRRTGEPVDLQRLKEGRDLPDYPVKGPVSEVTGRPTGRNARIAMKAAGQEEQEGRGRGERR
jgi:hypothetical protein